MAHISSSILESLSQSPENHLCLTAMLTLTLLHAVRHALPQVHALLAAHWSPALEPIGRRLAPLLRHDVLTELLSVALERERIAHYEARKASKKTTVEVADLRASLEKSKAAAERLKGMLERANRQLQEMAAIRANGGGGSGGNGGSVSLLNTSNGSSSNSSTGSTMKTAGTNSGGGGSSLIVGQPMVTGFKRLV